MSSKKNSRSNSENSKNKEVKKTNKVSKSTEPKKAAAKKAPVAKKTSKTTKVSGPSAPTPKKKIGNVKFPVPEPVKEEVKVEAEVETKVEVPEVTSETPVQEVSEPAATNPNPEPTRSVNNDCGFAHSPEYRDGSTEERSFWQKVKRFFGLY